MSLIRDHDLFDLVADPFCERWDHRHSVCMQILGARFVFKSDSGALLGLVATTYGGLPSYLFSPDVPTFHIELRLVQRAGNSPALEPPVVQLQSAAGALCGVMDASNYAVVMPDRGSALIVASEDMLVSPYHLRYELLEFAVFTLATRGMGLVPLHGACVGQHGHGVLLLGASGSGKSTLALHSLLRGLDFVAEDAVFVQPETLRATGVPNYLHVKADALRFIEDEKAQRWINQAPVIRRRSGVQKFEPDLRDGPGRLARTATEIIGAVFVSSEPADGPDGLLSTIAAEEIGALLGADQPYAAGQPGWREFVQGMIRTGVYRLCRGQHPDVAIDALRSLLDRSLEPSQEHCRDERR